VEWRATCSVWGLEKRSSEPGQSDEGHDSRTLLAMTKNEIQTDRIQKYLQKLTLQARRHLLAEIERRQACGDDMPGSDIILAELRAEFRNSGGSHYRVGNPSRYFFQPLEPLLVDRAPDCANSGQISRGSLSAIWEWISLILLPTMTRDYTDKMKHLIAANNPREAQQVAVAFQTKVAKYLESTLASADGAEHIRVNLAIYTSSPAVFDDLTKMLCVLRARDALAEFDKALPLRIDEFEGERFAEMRDLLNAFTAKHAEAMPFALTMLAKHLKTPWQLIRLATKIAVSKDATDIAATPYAVAGSMVLDQLDDKRLALRRALKSNRIPIARDILIDIYDIEYALRVRIDLLDESEWGQRLDSLMETVGALVEAEVHTIPECLRHVLASRTLHSHDTLTGRVTYLAWKGRDALADGAAYCRKLVS
jgi:hypothetical protein